MKRINNLYNKINDIDVIMDMYDNVVRKNTKNKNKLAKFEDFYSINVMNIKNVIESKNYTPERYNIFLVKEPKERVIMSQSIKDKIINHLVAKYFLIDVFDKTLINQNVATRVGRGTHYGLKLFKSYLNSYKNKYKKFYVLKFDIKKYFFNIDHNIVMNLIENKIKDKKVLNIISNIIDSTNEEYVNNKIDKLGNNLPIYKIGKGLPIGNMTSQIIATFYLDELDHYIKYNLKIKCYVRYMDDGVLIHQDKIYLQYCLNKIKKIIVKYKLELNHKVKIYTSDEEIEFLGFRFILKEKIIMKVTNKTKKRFKCKCNNSNETLQSYLGYLKYGSCKGLINSVCN